MTCNPLPSQEADFFRLLRVWFPCIYDIKYLMRSCKTLKGGLQDVADDLQVARIGQQHQAGSDSLLTASTFFKMRTKYFEGKIDDRKYLLVVRARGNTSGFPPSDNHFVFLFELQSFFTVVPGAASTDSPTLLPTRRTLEELSTTLIDLYLPTRIPIPTQRRLAQRSW